MANKKNATNTKNSEKVHDQYGILKRAEYKQINIRLGENMSNFKEITVKEIELKNCTRYYYSIDLNNADEDLISSLYFKVISEIREKKLQVVFEKIYGKIEYKPKFYNMKESLLKNEAVQEFPSTFIEGLPVTNS